jgi:hypothetical protein
MSATLSSDFQDPQALRCLSEAIVSEGNFDATLLAYLPFQVKLLSGMVE